MAALKTVLMVVFILISIALTVIVLMQEGKSAGLGAISGAADTYWGKNKGRSMEGILVKFTRALVVLFLVIAAERCRMQKYEGLSEGGSPFCYWLIIYTKYQKNLLLCIICFMYRMEGIDGERITKAAEKSNL